MTENDIVVWGFFLFLETLEGGIFFLFIYAMSFFNFVDFTDTSTRPYSARSPPVIPFCPSQLQEITLEHDGTFSNTMGLQSPSVPMRGRSVKEFEEQLTNLKKENFNLKLRIYFLEEKMGTSFTLDKDNIVKKYIELQVDYANLKQEMEEKQELLCQAVKAIELEDEDHKQYIADKEDQLNMYQQEIEDLRVQLQDVRYDSEGATSKTDTTGFICSNLSGTLVSELQEKIKVLENELHLEKENNASFQLIIGQTETLKNRYESMIHQIQNKEDIIENLRQENDTNNARIQTYTEQIRNFQEKIDLAYKENQNMNKKLLDEIKRVEEMAEQNQELKKKYTCLKVDLEREQKKTDRVKSAGKSRVSDLEAENGNLKQVLRDTQAKLESAVTEIRKNQNLAVSNSSPLKSNSSYTDVACISVPNATTPTGTPQKDPLHVQVVSSTSTSSALKSSSSVSIVSSSSSPDKFNNIEIETLLANSSHDKILSVFNTLKYDYDTQRKKNFKLKTEQIKACEIIKNMMDSRNKANEEIEQYQIQIKNLERELESVVSKPTSDSETPATLRELVSRANNEKSSEESKTEEKKMTELYKDLTAELEKKIELLEATLKEKDDLMQKIRVQYDDLLNNLEEKDHKITELENELLSNSSGMKLDKSCLEKSDIASEKCSSFYKKEIDEKDREIGRLNVELKKCSCYLQEIVNKELWDKNKEIEKLHSRQVNSPEILKLKKDLTGKEMQLNVLKEKISDLGLDMNIINDIDLNGLTSQSKIQHIKSLQDELKLLKDERDYFKNKVIELEGTAQSDVVEKLRVQVDSLELDLETSEKLKRESNEVCTLLSSRLEELAVFLDSLLKQKSILGFLGIQKERKLREIVNCSLDLSKSFNMSTLLNPDQSLAQLSNITTILNGSAFKDLSFLEQQDTDESFEVLSIVPGNVTLTYQSYLYKHNKKSEMDNEEVITALRKQIVNLKSELQLRDNELSRFNTNSKLSETDEEQKCGNLNIYARELSKVYDTPQKNNTTSATLNYQSECASESEGWSEPDRAVSKARIGLSQTLTVSPTVKSIRLGDSTDDDHLSVSALYNKRQEIELRQDRQAERLEATEQKLLNVVARELYEEVKCNLLDAEERIINQEKLRKEAENYIEILKEEVDSLTKVQNELKEDFVVKDDAMRNLLNLLEDEKTQSQRMSARLVEEQTMFEHKEKHFKELENELKMNIQGLEIKLEEEKQKLANIEIKTNEKINQFEINCEHKIKEIEKYYKDNYLKKSEIESKLAVVNKLIQELEDLKEMVKSYEEIIQVNKNKEQEFERKSLEHQEKVHNLRKELDVSILEYSELVVQKTRVENEKTILEQELSRYSIVERDLRRQIQETRSEFNTMSQDYQKEIYLLQKQKSELQIKTSLLESNNAELHNRFIKSQDSRKDLSTTLPNIKIHSGVMYNRQFSNLNCNSEDNLQECSGYNVNGSLLQNRPVDIERRESNASPDLGIESDQGRLSSLETHTNISRPLLQTIELTESMSNLLDNNNPVRSIRCDTQHCCQMTSEIANENIDLKRKLLRMRRALEETANQLNLANQRKKEVEKTICKQIHKTSQVLRKAKANLDSGSENDVLKM